MKLVELIRMFIPTRLRIWGYVKAIAIAGRTKILLYPLLYLLHGHIAKNISIVDGKPLYNYQGIKIEAPKDSVEAYVEVYQDNVYDRVYAPKKGDIVIDIGAYVGMYTIKTSLRVGKSGKVIAVEPLLSNIEYLESNVMPLNNVTVVKRALSNYHGKGRLYNSPSSAAHSMTYKRKTFTEVKVITLDILVDLLRLPKVDYIKMDAEGSDMNVLEGATEVLKAYHPILSIAGYHADEQGVPYVNKVTEYLEGFGYKCQTKDGYIYAKEK